MILGDLESKLISMTRETDLIKERLDLVDFLRSYLKLTPAGKNFKALCPFHTEKTPSFIVSPERKIWHCFGCGAGGDLITFVMKHENLEFPEALRFLAEKAGITISALSAAEQKQFGILYDIHEAAKIFFQKNLLKEGPAYNYLRERGLRPETIEEFGLGFAPRESASGVGEALTIHLINLGFDIADIVRAGFSHKNVSGLYRDRFQDRIMFPIFNNVGKTIAFAGRLLDVPKYQNSEGLPKYLNSPETPIFVKSKILYGLNFSKSEIAKSRTVVLLEGQMDYLLAWQSGVKNAVALSGTGLTAEHLMRLKRIADTAVLSFDNDDAGFRALERALDMFGAYDFHIKVINLGGFKDPAEAAKADPNFLLRALGEASPGFHRLFEYYFNSNNKDNLKQDVAYKKRVLRKMLLKIRNVKSQVEQSIWLKELARISGVSEPALLGEMENLTSKSEDLVEAPVYPIIPRARMDLISIRLLSLAFSHEEFRINLSPYREWLPEKYREILDNPSREETGLLELQGVYEFGDRDDLILRHEFEDLIKQLQIESLKSQMNELREEMRLAQGKNDEQGLADIMARFNVVAQKINELK